MNSKIRLTMAMLIAVGVTLTATGGRSLATVFDDESAWLPEVEELFVADVYSSPESAARAMAHRLTREIRTQARKDSPFAVTVRLISGHPTVSSSRTRESSESEVSRLPLRDKTSRPQYLPGHPTVSSESIRQAFIKALRTDELVQVLDAGSDVEAVVADLKIDMDQSDREHTAGALQLICRLPTEHFSTSARFVSKPWVEWVPAAEQRESDHHRICVRGLTEQPGIDASRDVNHKAVDEELLQRVLDRTHKRFPSHRDWAKQFVRDRLVRGIVDNPAVADRFQQTFHKTIDGEDHVVMVREAILLDVSDDKIEQLANPMLRQLKRVRERRFGALALGGGGILVSLVVGLFGYIVLNIITRGYYVWMLRATTAIFWLVSITLAARMASAILSVP